MRSKVRIPLGANNSLGPASLDLCGGSALHGSEVYLRGVDTRSDSALEGFFVIKIKIPNRLLILIFSFCQMKLSLL